MSSGVKLQRRRDLETDHTSVRHVSQDYIAVKPKYAVYVPHTAGRFAAKRFRKAQCPIVERLVNSLMMHGRNNGKKLMAVRIVKHAMEIIHLLTDQNPVQVIVDAIIYAGPREDATRTPHGRAIDCIPCFISRVVRKRAFSKKLFFFSFGWFG